MRRFNRVFITALLIFMTILGWWAWAQKDESTNKAEGVTLSDLGVTEAQKETIKGLWELKRRSHIQAIEDLKTLNRLAKDSMILDEDITEALKVLREKRWDAQRQIKSIEDELIQTLPPRAQLHLTVLGVLDNGLTHRRFDKVSRRKEEADIKSDKK